MNFGRQCSPKGIFFSSATLVNHMALCGAKTTLKGILWVLNLDVLTSESSSSGKEAKYSIEKRYICEEKNRVTEVLELLSKFYFNLPTLLKNKQDP